MEREKKIKLGKIQSFGIGTLVGGAIGCSSMAIAKALASTTAGKMAVYVLTASGMCILAVPVIPVYTNRIADWALESNIEKVEEVTED